MCPRSRYTGLVYMGGTGPCLPMRIIFGSVIFYSDHTILNIKFGVYGMMPVLKTPVYRLGLYGRYQIQWPNEGTFW